jgi:fatty-acid desaturase
VLAKGKQLLNLITFVIDNCLSIRLFFSLLLSVFLRFMASDYPFVFFKLIFFLSIEFGDMINSLEQYQNNKQYTVDNKSTS